MSTTLTKQQIKLEIYGKTGYLQKHIGHSLQLVLDIISNALAEGRNVELRNFGVFEIQVRGARTGRNPKNPSVTVVIPERAGVRFKSGKTLKEKIKELRLDELQGR